MFLCLPWAVLPQGFLYGFIHIFLEGLFQAKPRDRDSLLEEKHSPDHLKFTLRIWFLSGVTCCVCMCRKMLPANKNSPVCIVLYSQQTQPVKSVLSSSWFGVRFLL